MEQEKRHAPVAQADAPHMHCELAKPQTAAPPWPTVLLCRGMALANEDAASLWSKLTESLCAAGIAVADFEPRCSALILDDFHGYAASDHVCDTAEALRWVLEHDIVDHDRVGVLGFGLGAIAVAALPEDLAASIARVCLLNAANAADLSAMLARTNGSRVHHDLPRAFVQSLPALAEEPFMLRVPTLLLHGAADRLIEASMSLRYLYLLRQHEIAVERELIARADHVLGSPIQRQTCAARIEAFFQPLTKRSKARQAV